MSLSSDDIHYTCHSPQRTRHFPLITYTMSLSSNLYILYISLSSDDILCMSLSSTYLSLCSNYIYYVTLLWNMSLCYDDIHYTCHSLLIIYTIHVTLLWWYTLYYVTLFNYMPLSSDDIHYTFDSPLLRVTLLSLYTLQMWFSSNCSKTACSCVCRVAGAAWCAGCCAWCCRSSGVGV